MEEKKESVLMFEMSVEVAQEFYQRVIDQNAQTREEKTQILIDLAKEGRINSVIETQRTPDQIAADMAKNFGNTLYLKGDKSGPEDKSS